MNSFIVRGIQIPIKNDNDLLYGDNNNEFLYHYTDNKKCAIDEIIKSHCLKFGSFDRSNDPREFKRFNLFISHHGQKNHLDNLSEIISEELHGKVRTACFSLDGTMPPERGQIDIFWRGFAKPRMWAQYADCHNGVCLAFSRRKLDERIRAELNKYDIIFGGAVVYKNRGFITNFLDDEYNINYSDFNAFGKNEYIKLHIIKHYKKLYFEKMSDWKDESEWRWVVVQKDKCDILINIDDSLSGIFFGEKTSDDIAKKIIDETTSLGIIYKWITWTNGSPRLNVEKEYSFLNMGG